MGVIQHNAVIATCGLEDKIEPVLAWIKALPEEIRERFVVGRPVVNAYVTVILIPDGSKEGWHSSEEGDQLRKEFIMFLASLGYENGSNSWDYIEIGYGEYGPQIIQSNTTNHYGI